MARNNLDIVVTVRDGASKPLENVQAKLKNTGKAAKDASLDFIQFNKTLFTTSAFIATFVKGITTMRDTMSLGGDLERLSNQYERILGPKGRLFTAIDGMTTTAIGRMDALKAAIELRNLGIAQNTDQVAGILAKAGTAAKLSGIDAAEGIEKFTNFLKDGSVANLEALGLIRRTDPAFQALLATLNKAGGIYGTVLSTQAKLSIGMQLLNKRVEGQLKGIRDLKDISLLLNDSFGILKRQIGGVIGQALGPFIEKLVPLVYRLGDVLEHIKNNEKHIVFLAKSFLVLTSSVAGLISVLGTLKLSVKLLGFAGVGLPGLTIALISATTAFIGLTRSADGALEKLRVLGSIFKGVYELVTNLDPETGMSKMSKSTKDLLEKYGLLGFTKTIAQVISVIKRVITDVYNYLKKKFEKVDETLGGIFKKFTDYIANFSSTWTTWWTSDAISDMEKFGRAATVILGGLLTIFTAKKLLGGIGSILGKIPGLGGIFGGDSGKGPKGTASDPLYVRDIAKGAVAGVTSILGGLAGFTGIKGLADLLKQSYQLGGWKQILKDIPAAFSLVFPKLTAVFSSMANLFSLRIGATLAGFMSTIGSIVGPVLASAITGALSGVGVLLAGAVGYAVGSALEKYLPTITGKTEEGYEGGLLERMFFKMSQFTGLGPAQDFTKAEKELKAFNSKSNSELVAEFRAKNKAESTANNPLANLSGSDLEIVDAVGTQMQSLSAAQRNNMVATLEAALKTKEADGNFISPEELSGIQNAFAKALSADENLRAMGSRAKESVLNKPTGKRDAF